MVLFVGSKTLHTLLNLDWTSNVKPLKPTESALYIYLQASVPLASRGFILEEFVMKRQIKCL